MLPSATMTRSDTNEANLVPELSHEELWTSLYSELRRLALARLDRENTCVTLTPTALVHEAYLRLFSGRKSHLWKSRTHFFACVAEVMRHILIDHARRKAAVKHGGDRKKIELEFDIPSSDVPHYDLLALDAALEELQLHDPQAAQIVKLRYFVGLNHQEAADAMQMSRRVADRHWILARTWLYRRLSRE